LTLPERPVDVRLDARLAPGDAEVLVGLYREGETIAMLARRLKISRHSVRLLLAHGGIPQLPSTLTSLQIADIEDLCARGISTAQVARQACVSTATVRLIAATGQA
jgi:DNA-binding CsgD family transcriptional regulator